MIDELLSPENARFRVNQIFIYSNGIHQLSILVKIRLRTVLTINWRREGDLNPRGPERPQANRLHP